MMTSDVPELIIPEMGHFRFVRASESAIFGEGNWITVGRYKSLVPNTILPLDDQDILTTLARERQIPEAHNYRRNLPKPERKPVSHGRKKASKAPGSEKVESALLGGFNPFAK